MSTKTAYIGDLKHPPIVGECYLVDCIVIEPFQLDGDERQLTAVCLPILGQAHTDTEFAVHELHYHLDQRFMTNEQLKKFQAVWVIRDHACRPEEKCLVCRCVRNDFPRKVLLPGLGGSFQKAVWDEKRQAWRCPHKGTYLGNVQTLTGGCLVCPMHGLRIKSATGKVSGTYPGWERPQLIQPVRGPRP